MSYAPLNTFGGCAKGVGCWRGAGGVNCCFKTGVPQDEFSHLIQKQKNLTKTTNGDYVFFILMTETRLARSLKNWVPPGFSSSSDTGTCPGVWEPLHYGILSPPKNQKNPPPTKKSSPFIAGVKDTFFIAL